MREARCFGGHSLTLVGWNTDARGKGLFVRLGFARVDVVDSEVGVTRIAVVTLFASEAFGKRALLSRGCCVNREKHEYL